MINSMKNSDKHTEEALSQISESLSGRVSLQVINNIASKIEGLFRYWCDSMKLPQTSSNSCSQPPWYDEECDAVKKKKLSSSICRNWRRILFRNV